MRKISSAFRLAFYITCIFSLFGLRAYGQERERGREQVRDQDQVQDQVQERGLEHVNGQPQARPNGVVHDWSRRYAVYPRVGPMNSLIALQHDPRALLSWQESARKDWRSWRYPRHFRGARTTMAKDWNISLGTGTTAAGMFPAKYSFDPNAAPNCAFDVAVFPINVPGLSTVAITGTVTNGSVTVPVTAGTVTPAYVGEPLSGVGIPVGDTIASITGNPATSLTLAVAANAGAATSEAITVGGQPNIVSLTNLYSGPAGGFCNRPPGPNDDGVSATVLASYNVSAVGGAIATSPSISLDGTEAAFVETVPGTTAHFHVLAASTQGLDPNNAQDTLFPQTIPLSSFVTLAPAIGSGHSTDLTLGTTGDTNSSPFIDYLTDQAYVGNDAGVLFRINNVFCTLPACQGGGTPAPSLDATWGTAGALTTGCPGELTGPVVDQVGHVFVGCSDGKLYGYTSAGVALTGSPMVVGNGGTDGGIVDSPLVDVVNGFLYVATGNNGTNSVVAQIQILATSITLTSTATLDPPGVFNLHSPAFNNAYFNGGTPLLYEFTPNNNSTFSLWGIAFNGSHVMTSGTPANKLVISEGSFESSPVTEFFNAGVDYIFASNLDPTGLDAFMVNYNVAAGFPSAVIGPAPREGEGTSGVVVDNDSTDVNASSIYFGVLGPNGPNANSAVKLTQSTLQ